MGNREEEGRWYGDERIEDDPEMNEKSWATRRIEHLEREIAKKQAIIEDSGLPSFSCSCLERIERLEHEIAMRQAAIDFYVDLLHDYNVENEELTKAIAIVEELAKERYCKMQTKIEILQDSCDAWARIVDRQYKEIDALRAQNERRHNGRANW